MKTTLEIPTPLFKQVKAHAAIQGLKLKDIVASALDSYLHDQQARPKKKSQRIPFPLVRGKVGPLMKNMNGEMIAKLEELEELERYRRSSGR